MFSTAALGLFLAQASPTPAPAPAPPVAAPSPTVPRLEKQAIGESGCAVYGPKGIVISGPQASEDGSPVWTGAVKVDAHEFGLIGVRFATPFPNASPAELEALLIGYLDFIKAQAQITGAVGVGRGHTLDALPGAVGVIDYWKDAAGDEWAVKGWVDARHLVVLYIAGPGAYPVFNLQQLYLDGLRCS